jgi:hypothetical protein
VVLPALVTLAAIGISALRGRILLAVAVGTVVALTAPSLQSYYRQELKWGIVNWRSATDYVLSEHEAGDGIVFASLLGRVPFEYYLRRMQAGSDLVPIYRDIPWGKYIPFLSDIDVPPATAEAARLAGFDRVWAVLYLGGFAKLYDDPRPLGRTLRTWHREPCREFGPLLHICLYINPSR